MGADFDSDQKRWIEGFSSGLAAMQSIARAPAAETAGAPVGPDADQLLAQAAVVKSGGKLTDQEKWKRAEHPFDAYPRLVDAADAGSKPKPDDNFRWRYHGLFYVAPAQDSFMCRLRIPNGILKSWQFAAVADCAEGWGGGYVHVTTRANLQIREIRPEHASRVVQALAESGLSPKGAGADNIRNVTGGATAGVDPFELIDTRPFARAWHHHILNTRALYNLPRKFNVAFDGGGVIATLEDTNDIGFQAVRVREGARVTPGVYFRLALGGITGHKDLARDTGVVLAPADCVRVADAIVRVWSAHGDRTDRTRARMKYLLDAWGFDRFLAEVEAKLQQKLTRVSDDVVEPRRAPLREAHIGVWPQKQPGLNWIGVALPVGRLEPSQMRELARLAAEAGDGDVRLTVWQNLLLSGVPDANVEDSKRRIEDMGLAWRVSPARAGLVACTGNFGCKFANADTKRHALLIADRLEAAVALDRPINIHLTGCPNSCAQHYIGDIGLVAVKIPVSEEDSVEGYDIVVGGGFGPHGAIGRLVLPAVKAEDAPSRVEGLAVAYLARRRSPDESFQAFSARYDEAALSRFAQGRSE